MTKDLHKSPFDEGTKVKLALYENYIKEWLPVFLSASSSKSMRINIFDFFSGPGMDTTGCKGSPLITIDLLYPYFPNIISNDLEVNLFFNDKRKNKIYQLKKYISELRIESKPYGITYSTMSFEEAFKKYLPIMSKDKTANFLFLDQNGIKHVTDDIFRTLVDLQKTDFLFFTSSSTLHRFKQHPEIKKYINIPTTRNSVSTYLHIHRIVLDYYRGLIPKGKEYYLAPFSIKKGANIYGLIFGTGHMLGIDKFIKQCWKIDPQTGDSNFDIDRDNIDPRQPSLFPEKDKPKKLQNFEFDLSNAILDRKLVTNKDIYKYTLFNGLLAEHARKILRDLIIAGSLPKQRILISYDSCKVGKPNQTIIYE